MHTTDTNESTERNKKINLQIDLRDYFAAKAMQGMCVTPPLPHPSECSVIAERAYLIADAMLAAREK